MSGLAGVISLLEALYPATTLLPPKKNGAPLTSLLPAHGLFEQGKTCGTC